MTGTPNSPVKSHLALVMGTAGHIDHGKTALVRALTGVDLDRLEEEKRRGITIELGFVSLKLDDGRVIGVVDVPGHERFVKTMVAGAQGVDFVALVVAADEGVMPQTVEHLDICRLLGVKKGLVALAKCDKVDPETLELASEEIAELTRGTFLEGAPIVPCSATTMEGIPALRKAIADIADQLTPRSEAGIFRMPVDRSFSVKGFGTVVTGTVVSGAVRKGSEVEVTPGAIRAAARELEAHGEKVESAGAGRRLAINIAGVERREVGRGQWVVEANRLKLTRTIDAWASVLPTQKASLEHSHEIGFYVGTAFIVAELDLLGAQNVPPGGEAPVRLHLKEPLPLMAGDRFVLRSYARKVTIAGGRVVDPFPGERIEHRGRKGKALSAAFIKEAVKANVVERTLLIVAASGLAGTTIGKLYLRVGDCPARVDSIIGDSVKSGRLIRTGGKNETIVSKERFDLFADELAAELAKYHKANPLEIGPNRASFNIRKRRAPEDVYTMAIEALVASGKAVLEGDKLRLKSHKPSASGVSKDKIDEIERILKSADRTPPTVSEISAELKTDQKETKALLRHLIEKGVVCKVSEDLYFHSAVVSEIKSSLREHLAKHNGVEPVEFKNLVNVSRKFAIPLLEYFDRERFTVRVGNKRVLR